MAGDECGGSGADSQGVFDLWRRAVENQEAAAIFEEFPDGADVFVESAGQNKSKFVTQGPGGLSEIASDAGKPEDSFKFGFGFFAEARDGGSIGAHDAGSVGEAGIESFEIGRDAERLCPGVVDAALDQTHRE